MTKEKEKEDAKDSFNDFLVRNGYPRVEASFFEDLKKFQPSDEERAEALTLPRGFVNSYDDFEIGDM